MISLEAFLVFVAAASLPVLYVVLLGRWVEPEYRKVQPTPAEKPDRSGTLHPALRHSRSQI